MASSSFCTGSGDAHLVHVADEVGLFPGDAHYSGGDAHGGGVFRDLLQHHALAAIRAPSPTLKGPSTLAPVETSTLLPMVGWRLPWSFPVPPRVTPW